jgi:hypothetical protein
MKITTIQLDKTLVDSLKDERQYPHQACNELISNMLKVFKAARKNNQYDGFLHTIYSKSPL